MSAARWAEEQRLRVFVPQQASWARPFAFFHCFPPRKRGSFPALPRGTAGYNALCQNPASKVGPCIPRPHIDRAAWKCKNPPENSCFPGDFEHFGLALTSGSALGELGRAAGGLQAVLLSALRAKTVDFTGFFKFSRLG